MLAAVAVLAMTAPPAPAHADGPGSLSARAAILVERDTGAVIYARNAHERLPIASTTKLMTALVTLEREPLGRVMSVIDYPLSPGESTADLQDGQRVTVRDLLRALLLPSANEAAAALAVDVAGSTSAFVADMNAQARRLHMTDTHYATPVGLDTPGNYSSPADLADLADVLLRKPFFARTVDEASAVLPSAGGKVVVNRNDLVGRYPFVVGVKSGQTSAAGYCLVAAGRARGTTVLSVVLGTPSEGARDADTLALLRYGLALYHRADAVTAGRVYARAAVAGQPAARVALVAARSFAPVVRTGTRLVVYLEGVHGVVSAPLAARTQLGFVDVRLNGRLAARIPLVNAATLARARR